MVERHVAIAKRVPVPSQNQKLSNRTHNQHYKRHRDACMYSISVSTQSLASIAASLILLEEQQVVEPRPLDWLM